MGFQQFVLVVGVVMVMLFLLVTTTISLATTQDAIHELSVEYSLDGGKNWTKRGNGVQYTVNIGEKKIAVKFNEPSYELSKLDQERIINGGNDLFYLVRMLAVDGKGQTKPGEYLIASLRACALLDTDIEVLQLHCEKTGATVVLQFQTPVNGRTCPPLSSSKSIQQPKRITNKMVTVLHKEAPSIPLTSYGPKRQVGGGAGGGGVDGSDPGENRQPESVLQRYWYIVLPMVIWTLFIQPMLAGRGDAPPAEGEAQQQQPARRGGAAAKPGAAAAAATGNNKAVKGS
jgi:hypothetical protein